VRNFPKFWLPLGLPFHPPVFDAIETRFYPGNQPKSRITRVNFFTTIRWQLKRRTKARDRFEPCRLRGFCNTLIPSELDQPFPIHVLSLHRRMCCNDTRYQTVGLLRNRVNHGLAGFGVNLCSRQLQFGSSPCSSLSLRGFPLPIQDLVRPSRVVSFATIG
jgi:hypothetical protein